MRKVKRVKRLKNRNSGKKQKNWMISHQSRSPLNTNQFLIDRFEYVDNGQSDLNYGTISGECLAIKRKLGFSGLQMRLDGLYFMKFRVFVEI